VRFAALRRTLPPVSLESETKVGEPRSSAPTATGVAAELEPSPIDAGVAAEPTSTASHAGTWVVLPTYNEAANLEGIAAAILAALPGATLLIVDDGSPDGTGDIADRLAAADPLVRVRHRTRKQGLGRAYLDGFGVAREGGAAIVVQMDADWSHDPEALPALVAPVVDGQADLVIGSRYTRGGGTADWGLGRRIISRSGSVFARTVLRLAPHDLTGGFKAWRASTLAAVPADGVRAGGYVFQIEMTYRATCAGARVVEVPILFRDRLVGQSKMSRRIIVEAFFVVVGLRWDEVRGRGPKRARSATPAKPA
jgi:dolichol-phosphate mannosyltransferase